MTKSAFEKLARLRLEIMNGQCERWTQLEVVDDHKRKTQHSLVAAFEENGLPDGIMGLTRPIILDLTATYLEVDLDHLRSDQTYDVLVRRVGIQETATGPRAYDIDYGDDLGALPEMATMPFPNWRGRYPGELSGAYTGLVLGSPWYRERGYRQRFIFPLSGPALKHPAFRRLADFAQAITRGENALVEALLAADAKLQRLLSTSIRQRHECEETIANARSAIESSGRSLSSIDPALVQLMAAADWTNLFADSTYQARRAAQNQALQRLAKLDLDMAAAFLSLAGAAWPEVLNRLSELLVQSSATR